MQARADSAFITVRDIVRVIIIIIQSLPGGRLHTILGLITSIFTEQIPVRFMDIGTQATVSTTMMTTKKYFMISDLYV